MENKLNIFGVIAKRMDWLGQRQRALGHNIANADTPDFAPLDLNEKQFGRLLAKRLGPVEPRATHAKHMPGMALRDGPARSERQREPYEASPTGNSVVLEEQLIKVAKTQGDFQLMTNLYRKHMDMFRTALRGPRG